MHPSGFYFLSEKKHRIIAYYLFFAIALHITFDMLRAEYDITIVSMFVTDGEVDEQKQHNRSPKTTKSYLCQLALICQMPQR
jgi:hypothetical protein